MSPKSAKTMADAVASPSVAEVGKRFTETQTNKQRSLLIMSFYRGLKLFRDSFDASGKRRMSYRRMDYLIETYFRTVKDLSHHFFRDSQRSRYAKMLQVTFDLSFGIVFHLLLKFKETLRLAENYDIRKLARVVDRLERSVDQDVAEVSKIFNSLREDYERDLGALDEELQSVRETLDELEAIFSRIIAVYDENPTILRTLYANHSFFLKLFSGEGVDRVFRNMFPESGPVDAYLSLGFDFLRSGHLKLSERAFRRAAKYRRENGGDLSADDLGRLYRTRRMLFIGDNPKTNPEAARRLEAVRALECAIGAEALLLK